MNQRERHALAKAIMVEATKLYQYRDSLRDKSEDPIRQQAIDNDLGVIHERLREINQHTGVDAAYLNSL